MTQSNNSYQYTFDQDPANGRDLLFTRADTICV